GAGGGRPAVRSLDAGPPPRRGREVMAEALRVALSGADGRMGRVVGPALSAAAGIALVARIEAKDDLVALAKAARADIVVDFTTPSSAASNARKILDAGCHGV